MPTPKHNKSIIDEKQAVIDRMNHLLNEIYKCVESPITHQQCRVALKRFFRYLKAEAEK
jgi:hypothetical protein